MINEEVDSQLSKKTDSLEMIDFFISEMKYFAEKYGELKYGLSVKKIINWLKKTKIFLEQEKDFNLKKENYKASPDFKKWNLDRATHMHSLDFSLVRLFPDSKDVNEDEKL